MYKKINSAFISVYNKDGLLEPIVRLLHKFDVKISSTGGTQTFIENLDIPVTSAEKITGYPSILGGRVKTLHPGILGGILYRRDDESDIAEVAQYKIPAFDLVIVDLYPFEETVANTNDEDEIIEKIDIGGITLIRAAAKNFKEVAVISSQDQYPQLLKKLEADGCDFTYQERKNLAGYAFELTSYYDHQIFSYFKEESMAMQ